MSKYAVILLLFFIVITIFAEPLITKGLSPDYQNVNKNYESELSHNLIVGGDSFLANSYLPPLGTEKGRGSKPAVIRTVITAYTSSREETDDTPFITASGSYARYGIVAANFLPLGTKIRLPKIFGEQIFIVEDRLHTRYNNRVDIWLSNKVQAINFGLKVSEIEIL